MTFCNLNPLNYLKYGYVVDLLKEKLMIYLTESERNSSSATHLICDKTMNMFVKTSLIYIDGLAGLSLRPYMFNLDDLLLTCNFNGRKCAAIDFKLTFSGIYGNCYTFNAGHLDNETITPVKYSVRPGESNGLQLELFIGSSEHLPCWANTNGAFVAIHNKSSYPLFFEEGLKLQTGKESNLVVERSFINKMSLPYGNCVQDTMSNSSFDSVFYKLMIAEFGIYMQKYCIIFCANEMLFQKNVSVCLQVNNMTADELKSCLEVMTNYEPFYSSCLDYCPLECSMVRLQVAPNFADYPSQAYAEAMKKNLKNFTRRFFNDSFTSETSVNLSYAKIKDSVLSLNVYYDSLVYTQIDEVPSTTMGEVLSQIGGQWGLFLGISILSFLETFEMIYELIYIYVDNNKQSRVRFSESLTEKVTRV